MGFNLRISLKLRFRLLHAAVALIDGPELEARVAMVRVGLEHFLHQREGLARLLEIIVAEGEEIGDLPVLRPLGPGGLERGDRLLGLSALAEIVAQAAGRSPDHP